MFGPVTLSPNSGNSNNVFNVISIGIVGDNGANGTNTALNAVRPAITLSSDVKLSGSGTQSDPYTLE